MLYSIDSHIQPYLKALLVSDSYLDFVPIDPIEFPEAFWCLFP